MLHTGGAYGHKDELAPQLTSHASIHTIHAPTRPFIAKSVAISSVVHITQQQRGAAQASCDARQHKADQRSVSRILSTYIVRNQADLLGWLARWQANAPAVHPSNTPCPALPICRHSYAHDDDGCGSESIMANMMRLKLVRTFLMCSSDLLLHEAQPPRDLAGARIAEIVA